VDVRWIKGGSIYKLLRRYKGFGKKSDRSLIDVNRQSLAIPIVHINAENQIDRSI
jgi:hypothetical protein